MVPIGKTPGLEGLMAFSSGGSDAAAIISSQEVQRVTLYYQTALSVICAAPHKKGAGVALTRLAALRHNKLVRQYVHDETVRARPMTSE
jgi:hypothetical protein